MATTSNPANCNDPMKVTNQLTCFCEEPIGHTDSPHQSGQIATDKNGVQRMTTLFWYIIPGTAR